MKITMTEAQISALECSGLFDDADQSGDDERALYRAVDGRRLTVTAETQAAIALALNELSNAEDTNARHSTGVQRRQADGAARALANLYLKVLRLRWS